MKKAEDYFDIMSSLIYMDCDEHRDEAYKLIRIVQEDTIRDAVEECAENAGFEYATCRYDIPDEVPYVGDDEYGYNYIDKKSILSVANKLIKELEDGNKD